MKYFLALFSILVLFPVAAIAHTTILIPHISKDGQQTIRVLHFHPFAGADLMGIRLGVEDSEYLKGLDSMFIIHDKKQMKLDDVAIPAYYTVRGEKRET